MKRTILFTIFALVFSLVSLRAQDLEQGTMLIGTSSNLINPFPVNLFGTPNNIGLSFISNKFKSDEFDGEAETATAFNFTPTLGTFVTDDVLGGVELMFAIMSNDGDNINAIAAGPFARYYFSGDNLRPFVGANVKAGRVSFGDGDESKTNLIQFGVHGGAAFFVSDQVAIDLFAGLNRSRTAPKQSENNAREIQTAFGLGVGFSVFL